MKKNFLPILLLAALSLSTASCYRTQTLPLVHEEYPVGEAGIRFTEAHNYFLSNQVKDFSPRLVTDSATFATLFGMATTMAPDGRPTDIDFQTQAVIAVLSAPTNAHFEYRPLSLARSGQDLCFTYKKVSLGDDLGYQASPLLIIVCQKKDIEGLTLRVSEGK